MCSTMSQVPGPGHLSFTVKSTGLSSRRVLYVARVRIRISADLCRRGGEQHTVLGDDQDPCLLDGHHLFVAAVFFCLPINVC